MTKAPRVNQIRLLSSVAFEKAEKFMLEASCSAADAIYIPHQIAGAAPPCSGRGRILQRRSPGGKDDLASGLLDGGDRRVRGAGDLNRDRGAQLALGQQADAVARAPQQPRRDERRGIEGSIGL